MRQQKEKPVSHEIYYAARLKSGELYTRRGSSAPALFMTEQRLRLTLDGVPLYRDEGYTVVHFKET